MFKGLNFASAGSGLGDHTGRLVVLQSSGSRRTASLLSKSIFFISTGSNDMFEYSFNRTNDRKFLLGLVAAYKYYLKVPLRSTQQIN